MKRIWVWMAVAVLTVTGMGLASAAQAEARPEMPLIVGHTTRMSGNFLSELWGNNTADIDVRSLIHEYPTVAWTSSGNYVWNNTVISGIRTRESQNSRTYYITLHKDLYYSDGSRITAKDYVFSLLFSASPVVRELGGMTAQRDYIRGYADFAEGKSSTLSGVGMTDEMTFYLRIDAKYLPFYYDLSFVNVQPLPYRAIAPGVDVRDNGKGAFLSGDFSADRLRETVLDPESGYISHPAVSSGPYRLTRYDAQAHEAEFEINPFYKGNYRKQKPSIEKLLFREVRNDEILEDLKAGRVNLVNKVTSGEVINGAAELAAQGQAKLSAYPRTGLAFVAFVCEQGPTSSVLMRRAVARLIDRREVSDRFLMGHGEPVYGYYGLGQWMAREAGEELSKLDLYPLDLDAAAALLNQDGWTLNAAGGPFDPASDSLRHRQADGQPEPLVLRLAITENNKAAEIVAEMLSENLGKVGGRLEVTRIGMEELLRRYYRQEERGYDMYFLGTDFTYIFDPYYSYQTGEAYQGSMNMNTSGLKDEKLLALALRLRQTEPGIKYLYQIRWMAFQKYWVQALPLLPLYSNYYNDVYAPWIENYRPERYWNWGTAILYATTAPVAQ